MLLIGPPGSRSIDRRCLALACAKLTKREADMLTLTFDLNESDLKQRREIASSEVIGRDGDVDREGGG